MKPMKDRLLVKYLDDIEHLESPTIALIRHEPTLTHQAGADPLGDHGDYRRVIRRARVVSAGPSCDPVVRCGTVVRVTAWDDSEGYFGKDHAMIREADIALLET